MTRCHQTPRRLEYFHPPPEILCARRERTGIERGAGLGDHERTAGIGGGEEENDVRCGVRTAQPGKRGIRRHSRCAGKREWPGGLEGRGGRREPKGADHGAMIRRPRTEVVPRIMFGGSNGRHAIAGRKIHEVDAIERVVDIGAIGCPGDAGFIECKRRRKKAVRGIQQAIRIEQARVVNGG